MRFMKLVTGMLLALLFTCTTQADVVLSVTNEVDSAGSTLDVGIGIAAATGSPVLTNFNIPIQLGDDPSNFFPLISGPTTSNPGTFANFDSDPAPPAFNFDFATSDSGAGITLSSTPTDLFTLTFSIDPAAPAGSLRTVEIQRTPSGNLGLLQLTVDAESFDAGDPTFDDIVISNGSVAVSAIPEPSALCGLILSGLFVAARRRRLT